MQRQTRQREAIQEVLEVADRPLSPREIQLLAASGLPNLNIATVYRTLKELLGEAAIARVELPGESARYERSGKAHHHHFHCRNCDRVFELSGCAFVRSAKIPRGFRMQGHDLVVWGLCAACNARKDK